MKERITGEDAFGEYVEPNGDRLYVGAGKFFRGKAIYKLAAYEDTDLDPSEIAELKAENAELRENIKIKQQEYVEQVKINKAHINNAIEDGKRIKAAEKRARVLEYALDTAIEDVEKGCEGCNEDCCKRDRFCSRYYIQQAQAEIDKEGV